MLRKRRNSQQIQDFNQEIIVKSRKRVFLYLLSIVLLVILSFIFTFLYCSSFFSTIHYHVNNNIASIRKNIPVKENVRLPIDTSKIDYDENGSKIVTNRLNIALKDVTANIDSLIFSFKKEYPDSAYKVVYIDRQTSRIQIEFPEHEHSSLGAEIKRKLNNFSLLIWSESIFTNSHTPNDPAFKQTNQSWYLDATGTPQAWDITQGDTSVIVAIIDDGFDLQHPDFVGKKILPYNVASQNHVVYSTTDLIHGTHVAGIATANINNHFGSSGIAPKCAFMPIQIADNSNIFTSTDIIDGILYAIKNKANVINLSLGRAFSSSISNIGLSDQKNLLDQYGKDEELFWKELFGMADNNNVTIVLAGGNQNVLIGIDPMQRCNSTIRVSALDQLKNKAHFSNFGDNSTISAPGVGIYNCSPGGKLIFLDGTSMAAPIVTGAVALIKTLKPQLNNSEIIKILVDSAEKVAENKIGPIIQIDKALKLTLKNKSKYAKH